MGSFHTNWDTCIEVMSEIYRKFPKNISSCELNESCFLAKHLHLTCYYGPLGLGCSANFSIYKIDISFKGYCGNTCPLHLLSWKAGNDPTLYKSGHICIMFFRELIADSRKVLSKFWSWLRHYELSELKADYIVLYNEEIESELEKSNLLSLILVI